MRLLEQLSTRSRRIVESIGVTTPKELATHLESPECDMLDFLPGAGSVTVSELIAWGDRNGVRLRSIDAYLAEQKAEVINKYKWFKEPPTQSGWYWVKPRNSRCRVIEYNADTMTSRPRRSLSGVWWSGPLETPESP